MKKLIAIAALMLTGCNAIDSLPEEGDTALWTDPSTGCNYIVYTRGAGNARFGSLSIRYLETGLPDCPGTRESLETPI